MEHMQALCRELCKDQQRSSKHRYKADATSFQDLSPQNCTAQDSQIVTNNEPETLELAQDEEQKNTFSRPSISGWLFV